MVSRDRRNRAWAQGMETFPQLEHSQADTRDFPRHKTTRKDTQVRDPQVEQHHHGDNRAWVIRVWVAIPRMDTPAPHHKAGTPSASPISPNKVSRTHFCSVFRTDRKSDQNFELDKIEPISDDKCVLSLRPITDGDAAAATDAAESDPDLSTTTTSIFYGAKRIQPKC